jgi:hypothetical protein
MQRKIQSIPHTTKRINDYFQPSQANQSLAGAVKYLLAETATEKQLENKALPRQLISAI